MYISPEQTLRYIKEAQQILDLTLKASHIHCKTALFSNNKRHNKQKAHIIATVAGIAESCNIPFVSVAHVLGITRSSVAWYYDKLPMFLKDAHFSDRYEKIRKVYGLKRIIGPRTTLFRYTPMEELRIKCAKKSADIFMRKYCQRDVWHANY